MAQTVIGFFEDASDARKAVQKLESMGISRANVDLTEGSGSKGSTERVSDSGRDLDKDGRNKNRVTDFFNSLFGSHNSDDAKRFSSVGNSGCSLVTVHAQSEDEAERAAELLDDCGAVDVDEHASKAGFKGQQGTTIPRMEENLEVGKRTEERGNVRVRSRIVERPVEEHIRLREENVNVDRQPVDRPVTDMDRSRFQDSEIELTERTEVPVVNKEARVVEEVRISKDVSERDETIRDNVRSTEVDVDRNDRNTTDRGGRKDDNIQPRGMDM